MSSDERILHVLKTRGPQRAQALGGALGMSASGARQHLADLDARGLVAHEDRRESTGRPKRYWSLTEAGHASFPDTHSQLTTELIRSVRVVFGEDGVDRLIAERERATEAAYTVAMKGARTIAERVRRLSKIRADEGYMAECQKDTDGTWLLLENHCPICAAAAECAGFCRAELELFRRVLRTRVERVEHLLAGARRCAYRVGRGRG